MLDVQTVLVIIGAVAAIITIVGGFYKAWQIGVRGFWEYFKFSIARAYWKIPKKTLVILSAHERHIWWHMGGVSGKPAMQIVGDFYFTNISSEPVPVLKTFLTVYYTKWGFIPFSKQVEGNVFGSKTSLLPHCTMECRADWWITPPVKKEGEKLRGRACFIDNLGNEHWTQVLMWRYQ